MILLVTGQKDENTRIRKLNEQLNQANDQLRDYAINMERMTETRERNRLVREIHDALGYTLAAIMCANAGLTDVRRPIKAFCTDALVHSIQGYFWKYRFRLSQTFFAILSETTDFFRKDY